MYKRIKNKVAGIASSFARQEIVALTTHSNLIVDQKVDIEWEVHAVVKMDSQVVKFSSISQTKIQDPPAKHIKVKPETKLEVEIDALCKALGRDTRGEDEDQEKEELTKEAGQNGQEERAEPKKGGKKAKPQPPPAVNVTPKDKVRAPWNNNNAKDAKRKVLESESEDDMVRPGFSGSLPPKKRPRLVTSTPVSRSSGGRGSGAKTPRGRGSLTGGLKGERVRGEVTSSKGSRSNRGAKGSRGKCQQIKV